MPIPSNEPVTVWSGKDGEYQSSGPFLLADANGTLLVDSAGTELTDAGIIFTPTPQTIWSANDSL